MKMERTWTWEGRAKCSNGTDGAGIQGQTRTGRIKGGGHIFSYYSVSQAASREPKWSRVALEEDSSLDVDLKA